MFKNFFKKKPKSEGNDGVFRTLIEKIYIKDLQIQKLKKRISYLECELIKNNLDPKLGENKENL